jgi:hypothetical protein
MSFGTFGGVGRSARVPPFFKAPMAMHVHANCEHAADSEDPVFWVEGVWYCLFQPRIYVNLYFKAQASLSLLTFQIGIGDTPCLATEYSFGEQTQQNHTAKNTISTQLITFGRPYNRST